MKTTRAVHRIHISCSLLSAALLAFVLLPSHAQSQTDGPKTFSSPKEAVSKLIEAIRNDDTAVLLAMIGPGNEQIVSSGDDVDDKNVRRRFLQKYDEKHVLASSGANELTLNVGKDDWPLPIPLVKTAGAWYFDGAAGKEEVVYRRIGQNELSTIKVCYGVVAAEHDYASSGHDGLPAGTYAQRILSQPGTQNGLYWEVKNGEPPSPAGPLLAQAAEEGYDTSGNRTPYRGYYYRILTAQGSAPGSPQSYIVNGRMSGGFALVAYPADYRASGVVTFIVNQKGVIYQKDLGENTSDIAQKMSEYNPDGTWEKVK